MELEVYKKSDFYEDYIDSQKEYYERTNADAYFAERLAEKDREIAELKAKLENVQASMYCDVVDANMKVRRLKRALYKACANWAMNARMAEIEAEPWGENHESRLWAGVYDKCIKKAEEYK